MQSHRHVPGAVSRWLLQKRRKPQPGRGFRTSDLLFVFVLAGAFLALALRLIPHWLGAF